MSTTDRRIDDGPAAGRFEGPAAFRAAVGESLTAAFGAGAPSLWLVDPDFADWPLGDATLVDALTAWGRQRGRRLHLLAQDYDELARRQPRFVQWRRLFAHVVEARVAPDVDRSAFPTLLLLDGAGLVAGPAPARRGHPMRDEAERRTWREVADAISQRSEAGFPAHSLGL